MLGLCSDRMGARLRAFLTVSALLFMGWGFSAPAWAAETDEEEAAPRASKQMQMAIKLYEDGNDLDAMDRFMDVLVRGDPSERPLANEYLNMITQRMSMGGALDAKNLAPKPAPAVVEKATEKPRSAPRGKSSDEVAMSIPSPAALSRPARPRRIKDEGPSGSDRVLMKREIETRIQDQAKAAVEKLKRYEDIRVQMANSRVPRGIAIPADLLFDSGVQFKKDAAKVLGILSELIFSLGATQVIILPEGAVVGNAKILDMRRTMGISSHFFKAGVAPPRIRVNLLTNQVDIPRELQEFRGILLVFLYNQPLQLSTDSSIDEQGGPPISLGAQPAAIDPASGDGAIIEFSVVEPPAGLSSWRFQLLGPGERKGDDMIILQEVKGSAPVFHQIFWNGRKNYFGEPYAPGQYEAVLTATDLKRRIRKKHLWISVDGPAPEPEKPAKPKPGETLVAKASPPPADLTAEEEGPADEEEAVDKKPAASAKTPKGRKAAPAQQAKKKGKTIKAAKRAEPEPPKVEAEEPASPAEPEPKPAPKKGVEIGAKTPPKSSADPNLPQHSNVVNFQVVFVRNTLNMAQDSENTLTRVADTMEMYPRDKIQMVGYAFSSESDPAGLAKKRADFVKDRLTKNYRMDPAIFNEPQTQVSEVESYKVEIYIVKGTGK